MQAQAEESRRISQILMAYGLRPDLALHMEKLAYLPVEHDSSEEEEEEQRLMGQDNVLFWAVLLIHILELPTESTLRHSICQALHTAPGSALIFPPNTESLIVIRLPNLQAFGTYSTANEAPGLLHKADIGVREPCRPLL